MRKVPSYTCARRRCCNSSTITCCCISCTIIKLRIKTSRVKRKRAFEYGQKCADSDHPAHAQSIIQVFVLHSYILLYPMILLADSEGPDQTALMRSLILVFAARVCPKRRFRMARPKWSPSRPAAASKYVEKRFLM